MAMLSSQSSKALELHQAHESPASPKRGNPRRRRRTSIQRAGPCSRESVGERPREPGRQSASAVNASGAAFRPFQALHPHEKINIKKNTATVLCGACANYNPDLRRGMIGHSSGHTRLVLNGRSRPCPRSGLYIYYAF